MEWLDSSGVHVIGDLDDLRPVPLAEGERFHHPDRVKATAPAGRRDGRARAMTAAGGRRAPDPERLVVRATRAAPQPAPAEAPRAPVP